MDPMFGVHWRLMVTSSPGLVQMEYLQKEYFPFKTVIVDNSLQITLGKKIIAKCHLEFFYFFISTATGIILHFMELVNFSHKYSI